MALTKVSGSLIKSDITVGVVTATSFIGPLTGDVTGNASGTAGSTGVLSAGATGADLTLSGNITGSTASFTGNVSIAGTLTYEDVTNIDSVGLITARSGIHVPGTGNLVGIGTTNPQSRLHVSGTHNSHIRMTNTADDAIDLIGDSNRAGQSNSILGIKAQWNGTEVSKIVFQTGADTTDKDDSNILFHTKESGSSIAERLRITSDGAVNIGGDYSQTDSKVTIVDASRPIAEATLNLQSSTTSGAVDTGPVLRFYGHSGSEGRYHASIKGAKENGTSGNTAGYLALNTRPAGGAMEERLRIGSAGQIGLSGDNYGTAGQVLTSGGAAAAPSWSGGATRVLEYVSAPCNGQTVLTSHGSRSVQNVGTAGYQLTTSYALLVGSMITYRPPTGTTTVIYRYAFQCSHHDSIAIAHFRFYIGTVGNYNEVTYARYTIRGTGFQNRVVFEWPIKIGGTASAAIGQLASWNSDLTMKMEARDYTNSYDTKVNMTNNWDGAGTDKFSMPTISITALG